MQREVYRALGLTDLVLRVNSIGTPATRRAYEEALREHFRPHLATLSADSRRRFETNVLRILDSKEDAAHEAITAAAKERGLTRSAFLASAARDKIAGDR